MAEVALAHDAVIVTVLDAAARIPWEIDTMVFSPRACAAMAATLPL